MANIKSAKKRILINDKKRLLNKSRKSEVKTYITNFESAIKENNRESAQELLVLIQKKLSQASSKGTFHKKTISRKISRLTKKLNKIAI